jgi:hypothetical protein
MQEQAIGRSGGDTPPVSHFAALPKSIVATTLKIDPSQCNPALATIA